MEEKRVHARAPIDIAVACKTPEGVSASGVAKDISVGGVYIESEKTFEFNTQLTIHISLPGTNGELALPAVVRWSKPGGFGVQFQLLGARETHAITNLLKF